MPIERISLADFLSLSESLPVLDARSPSEFAHAHFPRAVSFPLFTDEERKIVGTTYKQESREKAIKAGLKFFGPKMVAMVEQAEAIAENKGRKLLVHCWRGGMRSAAVAWLLSLYGFEVYVLDGGYKSFRNWVLLQFEQEYSLNVLGGYTGSGKTYVLHELEKLGRTVIDLEGLASHKGSAFGSINMPGQPSQEMFENKLALDLFRKSTTATGGIWIEDESQRIGTVNIPLTFWNLMRSSPLYFLDIDFDQRLEHIVAGYGKGEKEKLINAIVRIQKRLGGLETKTAIAHLVEDDFAASFAILLNYYDKQYMKALNSREGLDLLLHKLPFGVVDPALIARQLVGVDTHKTAGV